MNGPHLNRRQTVASLLCSAIVPGAAAAKPARKYDETFRPQVHFSPAMNWTNDPNGLIWLDGEYHLFFQYNPFGDKWGHMSWGHAVSTDLMHWKQLPVAIPEDAGNMIFSGSAVLDRGNTSGFGTAGRAPLVAVYTGFAEKNGGLQSQQIAFSLDRGRTWTKYGGNPVLDLGMKDFRDPKVFWFEPAKKWVMAVSRAAERKVAFYQSPDLKAWTQTGEFGPAGTIDGVWECPDLFRLPVEGHAGEFKWVLKVDSSPTKPGSGCGGQAFVGEFDGNTFAADDPRSVSLDMGEDFYASASWNDAPGGRRLTIGWMANPRYAQDAPTSPWRGAMSLPREVSLRADPAGTTIIQRPVRELASLQIRRTRLAGVATGNDGKLLFNAAPKDAAHRIRARLRTADSAGFAVVVSARNMTVMSIDYDATAGRLSVARMGPTSMPTFASGNSAALAPRNGEIMLDMIVDRSSVEVFANDGERTISELMFPDEGAYTVSIEGKDEAAIIEEADVWTLKSVWS